MLTIIYFFLLLLQFLSFFEAQTELRPTDFSFLFNVLVTQLSLTLCDSPGFSVHEILQARILERVAISFSRGSSQPKD